MNSLFIVLLYRMKELIWLGLNVVIERGKDKYYKRFERTNRELLYVDVKVCWLSDI